jgi:hypothetical protein
MAADAAADESVLPGSDSHRFVHLGRVRPLNPGNVHPGAPMMLDPGLGGFQFNVGGSDTRKLQLQLAQPLTLEAGSQMLLGGDSSVLGLDATLRLPIAGGLSFSGRVDQTLGSTSFQSLGSIHCNNGTLRPDSYTASGCRFVNEAVSQFDRRTLSMGPRYDIGNISTSLRWFTTDSTYDLADGLPVSPLRVAPLFGPDVLPATAGSALIPGAGPSSYLAGKGSGIDLDFQLGFTTDQAGEVRLGLALTRIYGTSFEGVYDGPSSPVHWNVAAPFNTAALGVEWSRGDFSGGVRGYYREPVRFLERNSLDSMGTFDVHFTWRTPWNANLSVGASNVLNAGVDDRAASDKPADRFESIYGRIPYVRYQQDL